MEQLAGAIILFLIIGAYVGGIGAMLPDSVRESIEKNPFSAKFVAKPAKAWAGISTAAGLVFIIVVLGMAMCDGELKDDSYRTLHVGE